MADIAIEESQNGQAVSVKSGDTLTVTLPENPTTGFRWSVKDADSQRLKSHSDDFSPGGGVGGGGVRVLRFTASAPGETTLAVDLARSWETASPRSQFRIRVRIQ